MDSIIQVTLPIEQTYDEKANRWVVSLVNFHCSASGKTPNEAKRNLVEVFHTMLREQKVLR